jgi:hypothetical protein
MLGVRWFETDVSGLPVDRIFKGQDEQNVFLEERIRFKRGGNPRSRNSVIPFLDLLMSKEQKKDGKEKRKEGAKQIQNKQRN